MVKDFGIFEFLLGPCLLFFSLDFPLKKLTLMSFYVVPFFIIVGETEKNWDNFRERVKKFIRELQLYKKYIYTMIQFKETWRDFFISFSLVFQLDNPFESLGVCWCFSLLSVKVAAVLPLSRCPSEGIQPIDSFICLSLIY